MKILFYTDQTYKHGGIERVLTNKINYLVKQQNYEVHLLTTEQKNKTHCYTTNNKLITHDLGINYHRETSYFHPKNLLKVPFHFFRLKKQLKQINPDIVITPHYDFSFFLHKKSKKIKEYHSSKYFESKNRNNNKSIFKNILYKLNDFIESKYDNIIILTKDEKQHYKSNNTIVIPNGIDDISKQTAKLINKTAISAGRIAPVKGFDKLIDTWHIIAKKYPDWKLEIYGDGEATYIEKLQKQINKLNLQKQICLCGQTDNLKDEMLEASLYVMSSKTECFPMVLLEAQSVGLPIVSFDCPYGPRNIITNNQDGILVEDQNNDKLANAIMILIENENIRIEMGQMAKLNIKKLQEKEVMNKWFKLFKA